VLSGPQRELLVAGAASLGVALDEDTVERFSIYLELLQRWGKKINLTTRLKAEEVIVYHFLDSLAGVPIIRASPAARIVDLGAGAGFPSLPLKLALPGLRVLLVESIRKKVAFCQEAVRATGVTGIEATWGRGEDLGARSQHHRAYDWVVSRALGASAEIARLGLPFLAPGGRILLYKGEPDSGELQALDAFCTEQGAAWEKRRVAISHLKAARSLILVTFQKV
jgi:16S rRNA (guanine527-N7)-methyltransferase